MLPADAIICDGMSFVERGALQRLAASAPHIVVAAEADIPLESDAPAMADLIRGYNRLRGF